MMCHGLPIYKCVCDSRRSLLYQIDPNVRWRHGQVLRQVSDSRWDVALEGWKKTCVLRRWRCMRSRPATEVLQRTKSRLNSDGNHSENPQDFLHGRAWQWAVAEHGNWDVFRVCLRPAICSGQPTGWDSSFHSQLRNHREYNDVVVTSFALRRIMNHLVRMAR